MSEPGGPAAAGPPSLGALIEQVQRATDDNAEGRPTRARRRLRPALRALDAMPSTPEVARWRGRALTELAKCDFETRGGSRPILERLDAMLAEQDSVGGGWPGLGPAVAGLRGLLALRAGRQDDALRELDIAIAGSDEADPLDACRSLLNRGVLHMERGNLTAARGDLADCARRARQAGFVRLVFKAEHNLGYLSFVAGRMPEALALMEDAAAILPGPPRPTAIQDRARVLLEAGLVGVADTTLAEAAALFAEQHLPHDVAECELGRAECAMLRGDLVAARELALAAGQRFRRRGDDAWVIRSSLLALQADAEACAAAPDDDARVRARWASLSRSAGKLERLCLSTGRTIWASAAAYVRIESDLARGALRDPAVVLEALGPVRSSDPIAVRLHGRRIRAMLARAAGDRERAGRYVRAGQRDLGLHRARFGSLDLRTAGAVHGTGLADLDVSLALASGRPSAVLDAAERVRSVIGGTPRVNPPSDPVSAALLEELRELIDQNRGTRQHTPGDPRVARVEREAQRLKHEILARSWHESGRAGGDRAGRSVEVRRVLRDRPGGVVLDVLEHRGELLAVEVGDDHTALHHLGETASIAELVRRVHADLEVTANPLVPPDLRGVALNSLKHGMSALEARLVPALGAQGELVVVATGWLGVLPWSMLPSRIGRPTVVAPSVHHWMTYAGSASAIPSRVIAAAGPGLRHAEAEAEEIGRLWPGGEVVVGQEATVSRMIGLLGAPGIVHLAAHGRHEPDNPLFSSVRMADGPLFAHELDSGGGSPELVLLSSCEVGRASIRAGGEALGLASVLLRTGVGCVVAAVAPLPDATALRVMTRTHALLRSGVPVAQAVATATAEDAAETGVVAPLVCFGAPL